MGILYLSAAWNVLSVLATVGISGPVTISISSHDFIAEITSFPSPGAESMRMILYFFFNGFRWDSRSTRWTSSPNAIDPNMTSSPSQFWGCWIASSTGISSASTS